MSEIYKMLRRHEGVKHKVYTDSVGVQTIGVGRNLESKGLSDDEISWMLHNDVDECRHDLGYNFPWFIHLSEDRANAMLDMRFNLGATGFRKFKKMIAAMESKDYDKAAFEMLDSRWAEQVGKRAVELAEMVRVG